MVCFTPQGDEAEARLCCIASLRSIDSLLIHGNVDLWSHEDGKEDEKKKEKSRTKSKAKADGKPKKLSVALGNFKATT